MERFRRWLRDVRDVLARIPLRWRLALISIGLFTALLIQQIGMSVVLALIIVVAVLAASALFLVAAGSNPFGDRLWFGEGPGTFTSNNTWAQADGNDDPSISNNMAMLFDAHEVPEPAALSLLCGCGALLLRARRATWSP